MPKFYSGNARFEPRPGHQLYRLCFSSVPPRKFLDSTLIMLLPDPSYFMIHLSYYSTLYSVAAEGVVA
jgi:hypothetical protein